MYRDMVGRPERISTNKAVWWTQMFCGWDGNLKAINLYTAEGEFVAEFASWDDLEDYIRKVT